MYKNLCIYATFAYSLGLSKHTRPSFIRHEETGLGKTLDLCQTDSPISLVINPAAKQCLEPKSSTDLIALAEEPCGSVGGSRQQDTPRPTAKWRVFERETSVVRGFKKNRCVYCDTSVIAHERNRPHVSSKQDKSPHIGIQLFYIAPLTVPIVPCDVRGVG